MLYCLFYIFSLFSLISPSNFLGFGLRRSSNNLIFSMVPPPGGSFSSEKTDTCTESNNSGNQLSKPGCTLEIIKRNLPDGSTKTVKTLRCLAVTIENSEKGTMKQLPDPASKAAEADLRTVKKFESKD